MPKCFSTWHVLAAAGVLKLFGALSIACLLLVVLSLTGKNADPAHAAETDQGVRQCDEDYALCRSSCRRDHSCLQKCLQDYNACRRRGHPDR